MTPLEEATDALVDAIHYHERRCVKDQPHDHALLRKMKAALSRLEAIREIPPTSAFSLEHYPLMQDPHAFCSPTRPCGTACPGPWKVGYTA